MIALLALNRFVVAWVVVDLRSLGLAVLGSACLAAAALAITLRHRSWYEAWGAFLGLTIVLSVVAVVVCNLALPTPVFTVRGAFPLP